MAERNNKWATKHEEFSVQLQGGTVTAKDKVLSLTDAEHEELKTLLANGRPDLAQNVSLIDQDEAERLAREHLASRRAAAVSGMTNSVTAKPVNTGPVPVSVPVPPGASETLAAKLAARTANIQAAMTNNVPVVEPGTPEAPAVVDVVHVEPEVALDTTNQVK